MVELGHKWRNLLLLALAELLAMALWFSASAVVPQLTAEWGLSSNQQAWMTMSVQVGFVVGALLSALLNLADRISSRHLFAASALVGALRKILPAHAVPAEVSILERFPRTPTGKVDRKALRARWIEEKKDV